jgi:hypothetical protein
VKNGMVDCKFCGGGFHPKGIQAHLRRCKKKHVNGLNGAKGKPKFPIYDIEDDAIDIVLESTWQRLTWPQKFSALAFVVK